MRDISEELPDRMIRHGAKLFVRPDDEVVKYILENKRENYRSFIHIKVGRDSSSVKDLFNKYYYDFNLGVLANK